MSYSNESLFDIDFEIEEENTNQKTNNFKPNREALIFAIDCSTSMFQEDEEIYPFKFSLKAAISLLEKRIIQNNTDLLGILFYSTIKNSNVHNYKNIFIYKTLDVPDSQTILDLEEIENDEIKFKNEYGSSEKVNFSEVLITLSQMFSSSNKLVDSKRILLFTNQDNPIEQQNIKEKKAIYNTINDYSYLGIRVEPFFLHNSEKPFNFQLFYKDFFENLYTDNEEYLNMVTQDVTNKLDQLLVKVHQREMKKRSGFKIPFHLSEDLTIGIKGYNLVSEQKKTQYTLIDDVTGKEVEIVTNWICHDTTQMLFPSDFKYSYNYGGKKVVFTKDEIIQIKDFGPPGLTLLGFKPKSKIKFQYNLKHSVFIYPDESQYIGSFSVFAFLLESMNQMNKVAICKFIQRKGITPRIVALIPQVEEKDDSNNQIKPPGFHMIILPYADDIRTIPGQPINRPTEDIDMEAGELVKSLINTEGYDPKKYNNPLLQKFYVNLQTIALNRDEVEEINDSTIPNYEEINEKAGNIIESLKSKIFTTVIPVKEKRKKETTTEKDKNKKLKKELNINEAKSIAELNKFTVPELKSYLVNANIKPTKKKSDMIKQISKLIGIE